MRNDFAELAGAGTAVGFEPPEIARNAVERPDLVARIDAAVRGGSLTVLCAPAGYGKTTLVAQWARHTDTPVAWIRFRRDQDARALARSLVGALEHLGAAVAPSPYEHTRAIRSEFVRFLVDRLATVRDVCLVFDGLDRVAPDARRHLGAVIRQAPGGAHFVVTTRVGPLFGPISAGLRIRGDVAQFGADDLAFDRLTTRDVVEADLERPVAPETVDLLFRRTGGWPAAVKFAALFLDAGLDVHPLLGAVSRRELETDVTPPLPRDGATGSPSDEPLALTARERLVLGCLADRMTYREIAARLFISQNTVKTHAKSVYTKLGVGSRREAIERADELGLL